MQPWEKYKQQSNEEGPWVKYAILKKKQEMQEDPNEPLAQRYGRKIIKGAEGVAQGLGNAFIGGVQAATDFGESTARGIEKSIYGDNMLLPTDRNNFGARLADNVRERKKEQEKLPISERVGIFLGENAPTIAAGAGTGARVAARTGSKLLGLSAGGAIGNATYEATSQQENPGLMNRAEKTADAALIGGLAGPAFGAVGKGISAVKNTFSKKSAQKIAEEAISPEKAASALEQLKASPEGQPTVGLDIDSPEFRNLVKRTVSEYPEAKQIAAKFTDQRKGETMDRVNSLLSKDISPTETYFGDLAKKQVKRKLLGKFNYGKAFDYIPENSASKEKDVFGDHVFDDSKLIKLIQTRPDFTRKAAKEAADLIQIEHGIKLDPNDLLVPSTRNIDMLKKGLDALIDKETNALGKVSPKGRQLEVYQDELVGRMDKLNPDYKTARNVYAGGFAVEKAQELGRKFDKMSSEEISAKIGRFTQSEKEAFRVGQRLRMQELADKSKNPATALFGNESIRKKVEASFGNDEKNFGQFSKRLQEEMNYDKTIKNYGLDTHEVETNPNTLSKFIKLVTGMATGSKVSFQGANAVETALIKHYDGLNKNNARDLAKILTNRNSSINMLETIVKKADKDQQSVIAKVAKELYPTMIANNIGVRFAENDLANDAFAAENIRLEKRARLEDAMNNPKLGEGEIRKLMGEQNRLFPKSYSEKELRDLPRQIKKRFYRGN